MHLGREGKLVPCARDRLSAVLAGALAMVLLAAVRKFGQHFSYKEVFNLMLSFTLAENLNGFCLLVGECHHRSVSRYRDSLLRMLKACFNTSPPLAWSLALLAWGAGGIELEVDEWFRIMSTCGVFLLLKSVSVLSPAPVEISGICEQRKMNVAHGLAWSFYCGYLKLVLPRLTPAIQEFHCRNNGAVLVHRDAWKLLILVPLSGFIPDQLEEVDQRIVFHSNLPETVISRAGVVKRVYKHSVYIVHDSHQRLHHCVVEYATPLQTLYQMSQDSNAGLGREERQKQVLLFIRTLQEILENSTECRNRYQLIILDDSRDQETEKDPHSLSNEILKHLQQQEKEEKYVAPPREAVPLMGARPQRVPKQQMDLMSRCPTLMISNDTPHALRSPVEDTDPYPWN